MKTVVGKAILQGLGVVVVLALSAMAAGEQGPAPKPRSIDEALELVEKGDPEKALERARGLSGDLLLHQDVLLKLAGQLMAKPQLTEQEEQRLVAAVYALGVVGHYEAADFLARHITYKPVHLVERNLRERARWQATPCLEALVDMGLPAVSRLSTLLANTDDPRTIQLARWGLEGIGEVAYTGTRMAYQRRPVAFAKAFLEGQLEGSTPEQTARLKRSIAYFADELAKRATKD